MSRILRRATLRHLWRHPWQLGLAILGVALGVAVVVSVDVANGSAQRAFELSSEAVSGRATHSIEGGVHGLDQELYRRLRTELSVRPSAPLIESYVSPVPRPQRILHLLGLDPFADEPFRTYLDRGLTGDLDLADFLTRPGAALLAESTAAELGLRRGEPFEIDLGGSLRRLELTGVLTAEDELRSSALRDLVIVDIATAQEVLDLPARLTRIDLIAPVGPERELWLQTIRRELPPDAQLVASESRNDTAAQMTRAFRLNLQALGLLALLCGAFLIYNTMTFAVVQRRRLLATLRVLGTTRRQVLRLVLAEALLVGTVGTVLGGLAGLALGKGLVRLVTQTINDLYFVLSVRGVAVEAWTLAKGALIGVGSTLAAALPPALEASTTAPRTALLRSELEARVHRAVPRASVAGVVLTAAGFLLLALPGERLLPAQVGLFAILFGLALLTPLATMALMALLTPLAGRSLGQLGRHATRGVVGALSRTGVAVAALMIALAVTVGVDLMVRSFRSTVTRWLEYTLPADLYVSVFTTPARRFAATGATLDGSVFDTLRSLPGVAGANALRHFTATVDGLGARAVAIELDPLAHGAFRFEAGTSDEIWPAFERGQAVIVSEPLAYQRGLRAGERVVLSTPGGPLDLEVAGVFYDYSSEQGVLFIARSLYREAWSDDDVTAVSLHATPGAPLDALRESAQAALGVDRPARVVTNQELRAQSLRVFDRTFLITGVLRTLAIVVAFIGVLSALMALQLERTRELGVLRALGLTPGQLWRQVTQQTGLLGLTAGLFSLPVGITMAAIMVYIINRRSFGWSLELEIAPITLLQSLLVAVLAALLAGSYPAWRMARTSPAESLREE